MQSVKSQHKNKLCIILCTTPNNHIARTIAHHLLNNKLAACITLLQNITSLYHWEEKIEEKNEVQLLIKSDIVLKKKIFTLIKNYHPYKIPELLVLPIVDCDDNYRLWIKKYLQ